MLAKWLYIYVIFFLKKAFTPSQNVVKLLKITAKHCEYLPFPSLHTKPSHGLFRNRIVKG